MELSRRLFNEALRVIPGGVNSPVRAFKAVGGEPFFVEKAEGSRLYTVDGQELLDYVQSWGALILGHAHPKVLGYIKEALDKGTSYGTPVENEIKLAKLVKEAFPSIELVRFVNSGTEATMSAIRLARAYTKRDKIIKFEGCYHGHADHLLVSAGSGAMTFGVPSSRGVPYDITKNTLIAAFNDLESVSSLFQKFPEDIAAVIVEPVSGNMGVVPPREGFLKGLREITRKYGSLLIFDEIITGFRISFGGAQEMYGIYADITCLGKILGGGLPIGAYGGRKEIMEMVSPLGSVYQAGTLSGNPVVMAAGVSTLEHIKNNMEIYSYLENLGNMLEEGIEDLAKHKGIPVRVNRVGSMLTVFFTEEDVYDYKTAKKSDTSTYAKFFHSLLRRGIYIPPSQFEAWFLSSAHTKHDIERTLDAIKRAFDEI